MKSSWPIVCVNVEWISNVLETVPITIIWDQCGGWCSCLLYIYAVLACRAWSASLREEQFRAITHNYLWLRWEKSILTWLKISL